MRERFRLSLLLLLTLTSFGCATFQKPAPAPQAVYTLRVALYPIPDVEGDQYAKLIQRIQTEFAAATQNQYAVQIVFGDSAGYYDQPTLETWLTTPPPNGFDIVELDTIFLGNLVTSVAPPVWDFPPLSKWFNAGLNASTVNGKLYGVPHLLCGYFIFTADPKVRAATTATQLVTALDANPIQNLKVVTNFVGTNTSGAMYLDTYSSQYGPGGVQAAMTKPVDATATGTMKQLNVRCKTDTGAFPCYDNTFKNNPNQITANFNDGTTVAMLAYSEVMNSVTLPNTFLTPAPLGTNKAPVLFTDTLVMNRTCNATCQAAAGAFAVYITKPSTYEWFLLGDDTTAKKPRYLMPSTASAYTTRVQQDPYYAGAILAMSQTGAAFPNSGFIEARGTLRTDVLKAIQP